MLDAHDDAHHRYERVATLHEGVDEQISRPYAILDHCLALLHVLAVGLLFLDAFKHLIIVLADSDRRYMTVTKTDNEGAILVADDEIGTHMRGFDLNAFGIGGDASWLRIEVLQYLLCVSHLAVGKLEASLDLVETSCREFGKRLINYPVGILYGIGRFLVEQLQEHTLAKVACANARRLHIGLNHIDQHALDLLLSGVEVLLELKVIDQLIS